MAEWLLEEGIGEHRAILIKNGEVIAARIDWPGALAAGQVDDAKLISRTKGSSRGTALFASGEEILVDRLPIDAREGANLRIEVTRCQIGEKGRIKRAQGRPTDSEACAAPSLAQTLDNEGHKVIITRKLPNDDWEEIWGEAWAGFYDFTGGSLHFSPTPAMILIDVDGTGSPRELALGACEPLAKAIRRFDLVGSIGIDFPTLTTKQDRKAVDAALNDALGGWPHEHTAINGFGFVQLVSRFSRPSILHRVTFSRVDAAARLLLRRAEEISNPGAILLTAPPAIKAKLKSEWLEELAKRTGRQIRIETDPRLALEGGFAQAVAL